MRIIITGVTFLSIGILILLVCVSQGGEETGAEPLGGSPGILQPLTQDNFSALKVHSPFRRSLNLSNSLVLTGVARMEEELYATLFDIETKEIHVVSNAKNLKGWRLVAVKGNEAELDTLTAQIELTGSEVVSVRYDKDQLEAARKKTQRSSRSSGGGPPQTSAEAAANYRNGISGDGFRGPPPPELVTKLSKLSAKQRETLIKKFADLRNRGVSSEQRRELFVKEVDKTLKGNR